MYTKLIPVQKILQELGIFEPENFEFRGLCREKDNQQVVSCILHRKHSQEQVRLPLPSRYLILGVYFQKKVSRGRFYWATCLRVAMPGRNPAQHLQKDYKQMRISKKMGEKLQQMLYQVPDEIPRKLVGIFCRLRLDKLSSYRYHSIYLQKEMA